MALLLTPREREAERQKDREQQVKEATTLSQKVEELREAEQTSIKNLQDFQEREFRKFSEEKERRETELRGIDEQIAEKYKELQRYAEPWDKQFAFYVKTERASIEAEQARQAQIASDLTLRGQEQDVRDEVLANREKKVKKERQELLTLAERLAQDGVSLERSTREAQKEQERTLHETTEAKKSAIALEEKARILLREIELKKDALDLREKELEDRELAVVLEELKWYSPVKKSIIKPKE